MIPLQKQVANWMNGNTLAPRRSGFVPWFQFLCNVDTPVSIRSDDLINLNRSVERRADVELSNDQHLNNRAIHKDRKKKGLSGCS